MTPPSPEERFWARVDRSDPDGCWNWTGYLQKPGYGSFSAFGKTVMAHRFAYELLVAPIPTGMTIDHLCRNRRCVNPAHMEVVTLRTNILRGNNPTAINARRTHCTHGHPLSGNNLVIRNGKRRCCICENEKAARFFASKKQHPAPRPSRATGPGAAAAQE